MSDEIDRPALHLELVVSRTPDGRLTGTVRVPEGEARLFSGTMDLVAALEAALTTDSSGT